MSHAIRPGDVLAGRYQLVDLLDESSGGLFWRAYDSSLDRSVAVHIIRADDPRAVLLREAARTSARVVDRRILRVLDVDQTSDPTARDGTPLSYVVNEWATGTSLDILLADEGALAPRRSAWLVSEVAATIEVAHAAGVAHGRLVPENLLIDRTGNVRVIGFAVDAALHGLPSGRMSGDVTDLAGLLYAALTGRWAGVSQSSVKAAPLDHGRVLRPRQVRAGVPRVLDTLCDAVLNPYAAAPGAHARGLFDLTTAGGIAEALREFVGDPAGLADAEVSAIRRREHGAATRALALPRDLGGGLAGGPGALPFPDDPVAHEPDAYASGPDDPIPFPQALPSPTPAARVADPEPATGELPPQPGSELDQGGAVPTDRPTEAGIPIFDDDGDVAWIAKRTEAPPPPPPFEEPPARPLFAPDPLDGSPARRPRPSTDPGTGQHPAQGGGGFWPWDSSSTSGSRVTTGSGVIDPVEDDDYDDARPGNSWLRLAALVALLVLVLLAVVFAFNIGRGRTPLGAEPAPDASRTPSKSGSASAPAVAAFDGLTATDFDPQGDPPEENPDLAHLAVDGNDATAWRTMTYAQQLGPGGLKTGVGLVLDLGATRSVAEVDLTLVGSPTGVSVFVSPDQPTGIKGLTAVATQSVSGTDAALRLQQPTTGRYVVVWLTSLPATDGGFLGQVAEAAVLGTTPS